MGTLSVPQSGGHQRAQMLGEQLASIYTRSLCTREVFTTTGPVSEWLAALPH